MASEHDKPIDPALKHQLELLLADRTFQQALKNYRYEDHQHPTAYLAGSSVHGDTVHFDKHFAQASGSGKILFRGQPLDRRPFIWVHEAVEGAILDHRFSPGIWMLPGDPMQAAHDIALIAERLSVEDALGPNAWKDYSQPMQPYVKQDTEHAVPNPPPDIRRLPQYQFAEHSNPE